jgi:MoxR-like ATPase
MVEYKQIIKGYYDTQGRVKAVDMITQMPFFIEDRPDMKQRVEKTINSNDFLGIYQRGSRNGFKYIQDLPNYIKVVKPEEKTKMDIPEKPSDFIISDLKWKYLMRCLNKGKNIMFVGPAGTGKTQVVFKAADILDRQVFYFNHGSTQDPRSVLIGNTFFKEGTYFEESMFVKALKTPNAIILMDELSRANPEAWNILMPVLDVNIRQLRLEESEVSPTVEVAEGVSFVATANVGFEYTSARSLDRALADRFSVLEMDILDKESEIKLLAMKHPNIDPEFCEMICDLSDKIKKEATKDSPRVTNILSTRILLEMAEMGVDGFTLGEIAELILYPQYSDDGGIESERTYIRQIIQKYIGTADNDLFEDNSGGHGDFWKEFGS